MAKKTYSEKLLDPRWQKKRLEILSRDNFTCVKCGDEKETLHIHHIEYKKGLDPWDYENDKLTTLCVLCHRIAETKDPDYSNFDTLKILKLTPWSDNSKIMIIDNGVECHLAIVGEDNYCKIHYYLTRERIKLIRSFLDKID